MKTKTATKRTRADKADRADVYDMVTAKMIEMLEQGTVPWHKPWTASGMPMSMSSRKPYRGVNVFLLGLEAMVKGYASSWWGTYDKISERGGQVRKGERGTLVVYWGRYFRWTTDELTGDKVQVPTFMLRYYKVFNAEQADWKEGKAPTTCAGPSTPVERIASAEAVRAGYPNPPTMREGTAAYYQPSTDVLTMPPIDSFDGPEEFYSTLFHEFTHSTGHAERLDRFDNSAPDPFGSRGYSKEELVAEMGAAMLCAVAGIDMTVTLPNSAAYIASWLRVLADDHKMVVQAAARAQKAADHILGVTYEEEGTEQMDRAQDLVGATS